MNVLRLLPLTSAIGLAIGFALAPAAQAENLLELYQSARAFDATWQSARSQYDANLARAAQSRAGILPTAALAAGYSKTDLEVTAPVINRNFRTENAAINASQPLYRPANLATYEQGLKQVDIAQAQLQAAEQDLVLRVSQAYFDVLAAQDTLAFVRAQKSAVAEQLASAKRNFEVGTSTITDTREAQARYDLVIAQEIAGENDLRVKNLALDTLVGKTDAKPNPLVIPSTLPRPLPDDVNAWVTLAEEASPQIAQARLAVDVAQLETKKAEAGHKPTLDLTASYGITRNPDGNQTVGVSSRTQNTTVGLAFNLPLFAGFATQNRVKETLSLEEKSRADLEAARRAVAQSTRAAFFGVQSGLGQVKALEAAEASSQSALDANKLGYQVGVRINIDVLNSQSQLYQTKRDLAQARYNVLLGNLKLRLANGSLKPEDLFDVNAVLSR
jgi:outer membrane protein